MSPIGLAVACKTVKPPESYVSCGNAENKADRKLLRVVCIGIGGEIFADGYIIEGKVDVNNAAINGESKECRKTPVEGYVHVKTTSTDAYTNENCLFAGTTVMSGEGKMIVTDVGVNTVNGDTLVKMQTLQAPKTALDIALDKLSAFISKWGTLAAIVTFVILMASGIAQVGFSQYFAGGVLDIVQKIAMNVSVALTIIVAAVPEGLPLIVKIVTKQNVKTMERSNILAKNEIIKISEEHDEFKWVSYSEAKKLLKYDSNKSALWELDEKIKRGLIK